MIRYATRLLIGLLVLVSGSANAGDGVVVLRTEYASYGKFGRGVRGQLVREMMRQAVLLTARDEFGHATRDQTLRELEGIPAEAVTLDWLPKVRVTWKGEITLEIESKFGLEAPTEPITMEVGQMRASEMYGKLAVVWEEASRESLAEAFDAAGLERRAKAPNPDNQPGEEVLELVDQMSFTAQYAAVSAAHQAIASDGESAEWLAVLARSYANLGTLVSHHWTSASEVFYARSLLYGQRAAIAYPDHAPAPYLKPYALALLGGPKDALLWLDETESDEPPSWAAVIEPLSKSDHPALQEAGKSDKSIRPLTSWLGVYMQRPLGSCRSLHDRAMAAIKLSPAAFGVYSDLVTLYPSLGDQRYGAYYGPAALSRYAIAGLKPIEDLPETLAEQIPKDAEGFGELVEKLGSTVAGGVFTSIPNEIINRLKEADKERLTEKPREPSWTMLASLVEEEQFVLAANFAKALHNATETSHKSTVNDLVRLLRDHRYADFVGVYRMSSRRRRARAGEELGDIRIDEPRHAMRPMLFEMLYLPRGGDLTAGYAGSWEAYSSYDYRLPSLAEEFPGVCRIWKDRISGDARQKHVDMVRVMAPDSPYWLRQQMQLVGRATEEQFEAWTEIAKKDYQTSRNMGYYYAKAGSIDEAIDWYERSYELEPDNDTAKTLAALYRDHGQAEKWLPTLERFLTEEESRGLEHSDIQLYIANTYINEERDFAKALPYAEAAAQTYSARSLKAAMIANEGLAQLEKADEWAEALSTSYPSGSGEVWYFFRHRNGFGDPEEARGPMERALANDGPLSWDRIMIPILNYETEEGIEKVHAAGADSNSPYWYVLSSLLAKELGDEELVQKDLERLRALSIQKYKKDYPNYHQAVMTCADLLESGECDLSHEEIERQLAMIEVGGRRDYEFFIGAILQIIDREPDFSDRLLRRSVNRMPFDFITAHLAGHYLTVKFGVARSEPIEALDTSSESAAEE